MSKNSRRRKTKRKSRSRSNGSSGGRMAGLRGGMKSLVGVGPRKQKQSTFSRILTYILVAVAIGLTIRVLIQRFGS